MFPFLKTIVCGTIMLMGLSRCVFAQPLTRDEAVQAALEYNPEVVAAYHVWKAESARSLQAWAPPDPELELEYDGMSGAFNFGSFGQKDLGIVQRLSFPVAWWLRGQVGGLQAQAVRLGVYETTRQEVALRVNLAYDRVLANAQIVRYSEENVQLAEHLFIRAQTRFAAGDVPQLDVMRAEVAVLRQKNQHMIAQNNLKVSQVSLNALLSQVNDTPLVLADSLVYTSEDLDLDVLHHQALMHRSELLGAQQAYLGARKKQSLAVASTLPDVSFGVFRQTVAAPTGPQKFWRAGIAVELPVWAFLRQRGKIGEAKAQTAQADAQRDQVKLQIGQEVDAAGANLKAAVERAKWMQERILPTSKAAFEMAGRSYDAGKASYLELLEAQREWVDTQTEYVETLFEYRAAKAQLARATGTLLNSQENEH
ncbi:MAG: cobalt-zinc-cadmium efflux system outer membrane protein [Candidatus Latescibacterota bacterium]|jgi:cobalt-zinc-cadmium efflux system outer membrane protein